LNVHHTGAIHCDNQSTAIMKRTDMRKVIILYIV
jgi:hypothetical protein